MDINNKIYLGIIRLIRASLVIAMAVAIFQKEWIILFASGATLLLTFITYFFSRKYEVQVPIELDIVAVVFIYAAIFLGEVHGFYASFWWWDVILHTGSALVFGLIGFTIMYVLHEGKKFKASDAIIVLFSFCFAVAIGAVWEIFEFSMDQAFGFNMQKHGLVDTMWDLIVDVIGAAIASFIGFIYLKRGDVLFFGEPMRKFKERNPRFFKKKFRKLQKKKVKN